MSATCPGQCRGHRRYVGGFLDGEVEHLAYAAPSDFPLFVRYPNGAFYVRNLDGGTEAVYRLTSVDDGTTQR